MTRQVVVTGLGMTSPVGGDVASSWQNVLAGVSGISVIEAPWADVQPSKIAGFMAVDPAEVLDRVEARKLDRSQQAALVAAREAWADAGSPEVDPERLGAVGRGRDRVAVVLEHLGEERPQIVVVVDHEQRDAFVRHVRSRT